MKIPPLATVAAVCCLAVRLVAQTGEADLARQETALRQQLLDEEKALWTLRIHNQFLDCSDRTIWEPDIQSFAATAAERLGVSGVELKSFGGDEPILLSDGSRSPLAFHRYDLRGSGSFFAARRLLRDLAILEGASIDFDTLQITARPDGNIDFQSQVAKACWSPVVVTDQISRSIHGKAFVIAVEKTRLQELQSQKAAIAQTAARMRAMRLTSALGQLAENWSELPVSLRELHYAAPTLTLKGTAVGAAARASIGGALEKSGFQTVSLDWPAPGPCSAFVAMVRLGEGPTDNHEASGEMFDGRTPAQLCSAASSPIAVSARGTGDFTLHLRGVDVAGVFRVINAVVPAEGFILEPGTPERVNVDIEHATLDETFAALRSSGIVVGPGPLHRVCVNDCGDLTMRKDTYDGEPITMTVQNALATSLLTALAGATGLNINVPAGLHERISVFAANVPWDRLLEGIVESLHFHYVIDKDQHRLTMGSESDLAKPNHGATVDVEKFQTPPAPRFMSETKAENLGVDDLRLAAWVRSGSAPWRAYVLAPGPDLRLLPIEPGMKLFDGTVESAGERGVRVRSTAGREIVLTP